jgi:hypothetical protein
MPTFAPGTLQRGVISPPSFTFPVGTRTTAQFTLSFPSNQQVLNDQDVTIWHLVTGDEDEPGYKALNPDGGAGALIVTCLVGRCRLNR